MSKSMLFMLVIDGKTGRRKKVQYIWEPGVSADMDAKMTRIREQVRQCVNGFKWMVMDDYEKGIYRICEDKKVKALPRNTAPFTKFAFSDNYEEPKEIERWWN